MSTSDDAGAGLPARGLMRVVMVSSIRRRGVRRCAAAAIAPDLRVGRAVVTELGLGRARQLRDDALREHLAELDAPLVERIDVPHDPLDEDAVLVERDKGA